MAEKDDSDGVLVGAQWRPDGALELPPDLMNYAMRDRLSASTSESIASCPARWVTERILDKLLPTEPDPFSPAALGTSTHQLLEDLFQVQSESRTQETMMDLLESLHRDHAVDLSTPDEADLRRWRAEIEHRAMGLWQIEDPTSVRVFSTEQMIDNVSINGVPFIGIIDRVDLIDGHRRVVDYKAGLSQPKQASAKYGDPHGDQLRLYVMAIEQLYDIRPQSANVYYVSHGVSRDVALTDAKLSQTAERFAKSFDVLSDNYDSGVWSTKVSPLCGWCPLVQVCPSAQEAGKVSRDPVGDVGPLLGITNGASPALSPKPDLPPSLVKTSTTQGGSTMTKPRGEAPPYQELLPDGSLNFNSYAATACFGLAELAIELVTESGCPLKKSTVRETALAMRDVVANVMESWGVRTMQSGLHTRLRGALRTSVKTTPPPIGGSNADWSAWVETTTRRLASIVDIAMYLYECETDQSVAV